MTGAQGLYPDSCHVFVLSPQGSNWKSIFLQSSPASRGHCTSLAPQSRGEMQHAFPHQCYSKAGLQDSTLHVFLGGKRNFSVHCPSATECVCAAPSVRTVFGAAHQAALIKAPSFPGSQLLGPGALHGLCNMPSSHALGHCKHLISHTVPTSAL